MFMSQTPSSVASEASTAPPLAPTSLFRSHCNAKHRLVFQRPNLEAYSHSHPQLDTFTNALCITTDVTYRYRIHKGKAVRQSFYPEDPYHSYHDFPGSPASALESKPLPPNPQHLQPLRYHSVSPTRSSSVYSTDNSHLDGEASPTTVHQSAGALEMAPLLAIEPVSPPSSPDISAWRNKPHTDIVSPIDEDSDVSLENFVRAIKGSHRNITPPADCSYYSHFPVEERDLPAVPSDEDAGSPTGIEHAPSYQQESSQPRPRGHETSQWPPPPQKDKSIPRRQVARLPQQAAIPERTSSFGPRYNQGDKNFTPMEARPPWKGASGREQQIDPMRDDPNAEPLAMPVKGSKAATFKGEGFFRTRFTPHIGSSRIDGTSSAGSAMRKLISSRTSKTATQSPCTEGKLDARQQSPVPYPSPPDYDRPRMAAASPSPCSSPGQNVTVKHKPPPYAHINRGSSHAHPLASSPVRGDKLPQPLTPDGLSASRNARGDAWAQPAPRFSITTYATTIRGSPDLDPMEPLPVVGTEAPTLTLPVPSGQAFESEPLQPISEATTATRSMLTLEPAIESAKTVSHSRRESAADAARRISDASLSKPLPPAPPEISAGDRVAHLDAQLEGLANRRLNINRSIKKMTEQIPTDHLLTSSEVQRKRVLEKKKVENLRVELAEIKREEHELGMLRLRAYKRQNWGPEIGSTTQWASRAAAS